jgi:hypothetical protein
MVSGGRGGERQRAREGGGDIKALGLKLVRLKLKKRYIPN